MLPDNLDRSRLSLFPPVSACAASAAVPDATDPTMMNVRPADVNAPRKRVERALAHPTVNNWGSQVKRSPESYRRGATEM